MSSVPVSLGVCCRCAALVGVALDAASAPDGSAAQPLSSTRRDDGPTSIFAVALPPGSVASILRPADVPHTLWDYVKPTDERSSVPFGNTYVRLVPTEASAAQTADLDAAPDCFACLGQLEAFDRHAMKLAEAVQKAPFLDCHRLSLVPSVSRVLALTFAITTRIASDLAQSQPSQKRHGLAPTDEVPVWLLSLFKDTFVAALQERLADLLGVSADIPSDRAAVEALYAAAKGEACPLPPPKSALGFERQLFWAKPDDSDAIVLDGRFDVAYQRRRGDTADGTPLEWTVAVLSKRDSDAQAAALAFSSHSPLATALSQSTAIALRSNKQRSALPWSAVESELLVPFLLPTLSCKSPAGYTHHRVELSVTVGRQPVYLYGHYRKLARDVPQSPWFVQGPSGGRIGRTSLQETIAQHVLSHFYDSATIARATTTAVAMSPAAPKASRAETATTAAAAAAAAGGAAPAPSPSSSADVYGENLYKFHAAGREDADVRMLGTGRPFVLELVDAHRGRSVTRTELAEIEAAVEAADPGDAEVFNLEIIVDRSIMPLLHSLSEEKRKRYRCVCHTRRRLPFRPQSGARDAPFEALAEVHDLVVHQQTPIRVLHRRTVAVRPKIVHSIRAQLVNPHWMVVDLETQAGAYVKEFVHGDMGRTRPSLGSLLQSECDILQLDVVGVELSAAVRAKLSEIFVPLAP